MRDEFEVTIKISKEGIWSFKSKGDGNVGEIVSRLFERKLEQHENAGKVELIQGIINKISN